MVKEWKEIIERVKNMLPDATTDEAIAIIEDMTDTAAENKAEKYDELVAELKDLKSKYDEMDKSWRQKYIDRFFAGEDEIKEKIVEEKIEKEKDDKKEEEKKKYKEDIFE